MANTAGRNISDLGAALARARGRGDETTDAAAAPTGPQPLTWEAWRAHVYRTVRTDLSQECTLVNATLGLAGESGEIADHIKKWQWQGHDLDHTHLVEELGDLLWYWTIMVSELGFTAEEVMLENIAKLRRRYPSGFDSERSRHRAEDEEDHQEGHQEEHQEG